MRAFILSIDEAAWQTIEDGWTEPFVTTIDGNSRPMERSKYTPKEKKRVAHGNFKALYAIFNGVDMQQFKVIVVWKFTKNAWTILQNKHEGND